MNESKGNQKPAPKKAAPKKTARAKKRLRKEFGRAFNDFLCLHL